MESRIMSTHPLHSILGNHHHLHWNSRTGRIWWNCRWGSHRNPSHNWRLQWDQAGLEARSRFQIRLLWKWRNAGFRKPPLFFRIRLLKTTNEPTRTKLHIYFWALLVLRKYLQTHIVCESWLTVKKGIHQNWPIRCPQLPLKYPSGSPEILVDLSIYLRFLNFEDFSLSRNCKETMEKL